MIEKDMHFESQSIILQYNGYITVRFHIEAYKGEINVTIKLKGDRVIY